MECEVRLIGNIGQNPELHQTADGKHVCNFRLATDSVYKDSTGTWKKVTEWHDVICFGKTASALVQNKKTGDQVYVSGTLSSKTVEDKAFRDKDGNPCKKTYWRILASKIIYLGKKNSQNVDER